MIFCFFPALYICRWRYYDIFAENLKDIKMNLMTIFLTAEAPAQGGGGMSFIWMMLLIFVVMWFFMIRPQQKKQKEMVKFRDSLEKGQKVVTAGGIYGTVKEVKEGYVVLEVDNNVTLRVDKAMIVRAPEAAPGKK